MKHDFIKTYYLQKHFTFRPSPKNRNEIGELFSLIGAELMRVCMCIVRLAIISPLAWVETVNYDFLCGHKFIISFCQPTHSPSERAL